MSADITTLGLAIDSTKVTKAREELGRFVKAGDEAAGAATRVEGSAQKMGGALGSVRNILAGMALGATAVELIKMADAMSLTDSRLRLAVGSAENFTKAQEAIYAISQKSNVGIAETSQLFTKLHAPVVRLGGSVKETAAIVESFSSSMRVGGASAQEAAAATLQFAQAMGSGKLQGDEFRSLAEASPRFMKALADGMGVPIEKLKEMGTQGKLTADIVGNALTKSLSQLRVEMSQIPDTVGGALTRLANDFKLAVNDLNKTTGTTLGLAGGIEEARKLIPDLKSELEDVFSSMSDWLGRNKEGLGEILSVVKSVVGDIWDAVKALGSFTGFVIEAGVKLGVFKTLWETVRLLVAGVKDGVEIIGAALALVGSKIIQFLVTPLIEGGRLAAAIAGVFDKGLADSMRATIDRIEAFAKAGEGYARDVAQKFADGKSAVMQLSDAMAKSATDSAALKEALALGAASASDSAREMSKFGRQADAAGSSLVTLKNSHAGVSEEQSKLIGKYKELQQSLQVRVAELDAEIAGTGKLNEAEKASVRFKQDLLEKYKAFTPTQKKAIEGLLDEWDARLKLQEAMKDQAEAQNEAYKEKMKLWEAGERDVAQIRQATRQQREQNDTMRMTRRELDQLEDARLDDAIAAARQAVEIDKLKQYCDAETQAHKETLEALLELKSARGQGSAIAAAQEAAYEWQRTAENIYGWLSNALMRAFDDGRGFWSSLWDQIKNAFKTTVLNLIVRTAVDWVGLALGLSGAGGQGGVGGVAGANGTMNLISLGSKAYGAATGYSPWVNSAASFFGAGSSAGAAAGSLTYANAVGAVGGDAMGAFIAANGSWGGVSAGGAAAGGGAAGGAAGAGSAWMSAAGYAALVVAAIALADKLYEEGYTGSDKIGTDGAAGKFYAGTFERYKTESLKGLGLSDKWAEIFGGSVRMNWTLDKLGMISTPHTGGYSYATEAGVENLTARQNGIANPQTQEWTDTFSKDILKMIGGVAKNWGVESNVKGVRSIFESDNKDGSWGLFHLEGESGRVAGFDALGTLPSKAGEGFDKYTDMAAGAIVDALTKLKLPEWVTNQLKDLGDDLSMEDLSGKLVELMAVQDALGKVAGEFASLGGVFANLSAASSDAKFALVALAGSVEGLSAMSASYIQNFYSATEQTDLIMGQIKTSLSAVGLAMPKTREEFRGMVDALDLNAEAGRQAFITAMNVQEAFAAVVPPAEKVVEAVEEQGDTLEKAAVQTNTFTVQTENAAARIIEAWSSVTDAMINEVNRLRGVMGKTTPGESLAALQAKFAIDAARARAGDPEAAKRLVSWSQQIDSLAGTQSRTRYEAASTRAGLAATLESIAVQNGGNSANLVYEVGRMRADVVAALRQAATDQSRTANSIRRATDGDALRTRTAV